VLDVITKSILGLIGLGFLVGCYYLQRDKDKKNVDNIEDR